MILFKMEHLGGLQLASLNFTRFSKYSHLILKRIQGKGLSSLEYAFLLLFKGPFSPEKSATYFISFLPAFIWVLLFLCPVISIRHALEKHLRA